jgi:hypothetical protein
LFGETGDEVQKFRSSDGKNNAEDAENAEFAEEQKKNRRTQKRGPVSEGSGGEN